VDKTVGSPPADFVPHPNANSAASSASEPAAPTDADLAALDTAFRDHIAALKEIDEVLKRMFENPVNQLPPGALDGPGQRAVATRQRLLELAPPPPAQPMLRHEPTPVERVMGRYSNELRELSGRVIGHLRNAAMLAGNDSEMLRALATQLEARPGSPPRETVPQGAVSPAPMPTGSPAPPPAQTGPVELTAEELWAALQGGNPKSLKLADRDKIRVTGIVSSKTVRGFKQVTLAGAERGALMLWWGPGVDSSDVRPLQTIQVEGKLSTTSGIDNLPGLLEVSILKIVAAEPGDPPPLFLIFSSADELVAAANEPDFRDRNRLIVSMNRPIIVSGEVATIEEFKNEYLEQEKLIILKTTTRGVACRFSLSAEAASLKPGHAVRVAALPDLGFHAGRPKEEVWLKDCWLCPEK
jgi:hypothetical protein